MVLQDHSDSYRRRVVDDELDALLPHLPAIALEGAKGVGKTATAARRATTIVRLDEPRQRALVGAAPERMVQGQPPILIDEWQRLPESFDLVRRAVDDGAGPGTFLMTGSPPAVGTPVHSGAGRIVVMRMRPLTLVERGAGATVSLAALLTGHGGAIGGTTDRGPDHYADEIVRSGFPGLRDGPEYVRRARLDGYLDRLVEHDFAEMGHVVRNPVGLRRWLSAYAAASATSASFETVRDAATGGQGDKPSRTAAGPYRDVLERLLVIEPVPAWLPSRSRINRLAAAPKHQLVDPALAARLLGLDAAALLAGRQGGPPGGGPLLGALFESLVTLGVRVYAQAAQARVGHLRTHRGEREVDLIVERADGRILAIEVKLTATVEDRDVRHLHWLRGQVGEELLDAVVVTTGRDAYRRPDGIAVVPAALLGP
jgi:predicted AAA+ superfamily ATPase